VLAPRGMMALFGQSSGPVAPLDPQLLNQKGSVFLTRPTLAHYIATREELLWRSGELFDWIARGELSVRIGTELPLRQAAEAQRMLASMAAQTQAARNATLAQADRVAHYTSLAMWVSFLSGFLALLAAAGGGWMGANNLHRVFHLRRYDGRPVRSAVT